MTVPVGSEQLRELGGLLLSCVQVREPMLAVRAAHWRNALLRVGLPVPFWVVHDVGLLLVASPDVIERRAATAHVRLSPSVLEAHGHWVATMRALASTEVAEVSRSHRLSEPMVAVILLRVLGPLYERHLGPGRRPTVAPMPLDPEVYVERTDAELAQLFTQFDRATDLQFLEHLARERIRTIIAFEQLDLDTLKLLGMLGAEASAASAFGMLDLLEVFGNPSANDIVNFSLDLLPSVLETRRATGVQSFSVDGYAGLARRGTVDSLVLSELAFDEDLFDQRFVENEVFYYTRDREHEDERRVHYIVCDATASMRGQRSVFARGLVLTLAKKLALRGEDVFFRFFDARLYDVQHARARKRGQPGLDVPYVLTFKGEHGRNYAKVFAQLVDEVARVARREKKRPVLYLLTHAESHVPVETIERLRQVATLYGIFMLPSSGTLDLEYVSRLHTVQIVDEAALRQRDARVDRALAIVDDAASDERDDAGKKAATPSRDDDLAQAERELEAYLGGGPS